MFVLHQGDVLFFLLFIKTWVLNKTNSSPGKVQLYQPETSHPQQAFCGIYRDDIRAFFQPVF